MRAWSDRQPGPPKAYPVRSRYHRGQEDRPERHQDRRQGHHQPGQEVDSLGGRQGLLRRESRKEGREREHGADLQQPHPRQHHGLLDRGGLGRRRRAARQKQRPRGRRRRRGRKLCHKVSTLFLIIKGQSKFA